jgi:hypothetical protein
MGKITDERLEEIRDEIWGDEQRTEESIMAAELLQLRADALVSQQFQSDVLMPLFDKLEQAGYSGTWSQKVDAVCELAGLKQANLAYKNGIHQGRIDAFMLVEGALYKNRHKDNVNKMLDMVEVMLREENKRSILPLESEGTK